MITFQRKASNRRVVNEEQLIKLLQSYGQVRGRNSFHLLWDSFHVLWDL